MRFVLLNQFFPPAQAPTGRLLGDLAGMLAARGHAVVVITSAAGYGAEDGTADRPLPGVQVIRTGCPARHGHNLGGKFGDYLAFFRGAWRELRRLEKPDALVCMTTPPFLGLFGAHLRKTCGPPYLLWCMDLYPEALVAHGVLNAWNPLAVLLRRLARTERGRAAAVIALGPDMADRLRDSGAGRIVEVPVWSGLQPLPAQSNRLREYRRACGWADEDLVCLYSGNMGRAHCAADFAALAESLRGRQPRCRFVFAGAGPARSDWERRWGGLFEFRPPAAEEICAVHLQAADVHLVSQRPEWTGVVVPSKFQAACALGRPVVYAGAPQSAVGNWLQRADCGWLLAPGDRGAIESAARDLLDPRQREEKGRRAFRLYEEMFTPDRNCGKVANLAEEVAQAKP